MNARLQMLYGLLIDDIRARKRQQWLIASSAIAIDLILAGVFDLSDSNGFKGRESLPQWSWALVVISGLVSLAGIWLIARDQLSMVKCRMRLGLLEDCIDPSERWHFTGFDPKNYRSPFYRFEVVVFLVVVVLMGGGTISVLFSNSAYVMWAAIGAVGVGTAVLVGRYFPAARKLEARRKDLQKEHRLPVSSNSEKDRRQGSLS
jgi:hypothetical protein